MCYFTYPNGEDFIFNANDDIFRHDYKYPSTMHIMLLDKFDFIEYQGKFW
jgi:hypothetical protein